MCRIIPPFHHATLASHIQRLNRIFIHIVYTHLSPSGNKHCAQASKATCDYGLHCCMRVQFELVSCLGQALGLLSVFPDVCIHHRL